MEQRSREDAVSRSHTTQQVEQRFIFELQEKVGAQGTYQRVSLIVWCLCGFFTGSILLGTPFMLYEDPYVCPPQITQNCEAYVCSLLPSQRSAYLGHQTIHSLLNQYGDFRCNPQKNHVSLMILIMYFGVIASQLFLALAGDIFTRKTLSVVGFASLIAGFIIVLVAINLVMAVSGLFLMMMGVQLVYTYSFIFLCETVSQEIREQYQVWIHITFGLGQCANVGLYYWLGDWKPILIYFYLIPAIIAFLILVFFVVDTPICLVKSYQLDEAYARFMWIAKINKIQNCDLKKQDLIAVKQMQNVREQAENTNSKFTLLDLFKYSSLRYVTIFVILVRISVDFLYFVPNFMVAEFQLSIFINSLSLGVSSLLAFVISYFIISDVKRKTFGIVSFVIIFICTLVLIYFWKPRSDGQALPLSTNLAILAAIIIINLLISLQYSFLQVYTTQLYPSQVRVIALGFVIVMGAGGVSVSEFIVNACTENGVSVMIVFAVLAVVAIISSIILPETLKKPPPQIIEQLTTVRMSQRSQRDRKTEKHQSPQNSNAYMDFDDPNPNLKKISFSNILENSILNREQQMKYQDEVKSQEVEYIVVEVRPPVPATDQHNLSQTIKQDNDLDNEGVQNPPTTNATNLDNCFIYIEYEDNVGEDVETKKDSEQVADVHQDLDKKIQEQRSDEHEDEVRRSSQDSVGGTSEDEERPSEQGSQIFNPFQQKKDFNNVLVQKSQKKLET